MPKRTMPNLTPTGHSSCPDSEVDMALRMLGGDMVVLKPLTDMLEEVDDELDRFCDADDGRND